MLCDVEEPAKFDPVACPLRFRDTDSGVTSPFLTCKFLGALVLRIAEGNVLVFVAEVKDAPVEVEFTEIIGLLEPKSSKPRPRDMGDP